MPWTEVVRNFGEYRIVRCYIVVVEKSNSFNSWERQISTLLCPFLRLRAPLRPDTTTLGCQWGLGTGQNHRSAAACSRCSRYSSVHQSTSTRGGPGPPPPHRPQFAALFPATWLRCRWFCGHLNDWLKWAVAPSKPSDDRAGAHWQAVRKWLKWAHSHRRWCSIFAYFCFRQGWTA